jgi:hypothetical protein
LALARPENIATTPFSTGSLNSGTIVGLAVALLPLKMLKNPALEHFKAVSFAC